MIDAITIAAIIAKLENACKLTLMFHDGSEWTYDKRNEWTLRATDELGHGRCDATTKVLCDVIREALDFAKDNL